MLRGWLAAGVAGALLACAHAPPPVSKDSSEELVRSVIAEVEEIRGLKAKEPIQVEILPPPEFKQKVDQRTAEHLADTAEEKAIWVAFGFAAPSIDARKEFEAVLDEQVAGFYSPKDKKLFVRSKAPTVAGADGPLILRGILAHEIEHALQDQNFGIFDAKGLDDDAALGRAALVEGDAMLVTVAVTTRAKGIPLAQGLQNIAMTVKAMTPEIVARMSGFSTKLLEAPVLLREELVFPYMDGLAFTSTAYHTGGFELINRMFGHPPRNSHQILRPQAYAEGRMPSPVEPPQLPREWTEIHSGAMGELGTRAVLGVCAGRADAVHGAAAWAGDAYRIGRKPDGTLALVWKTVWRNPKGASAFIAQLEQQRPCWLKNRGDGPGSVGEAISITSVTGNLVIVSRGVTQEEAAPLLASWNERPPPPPPPDPPLGPLKLVAVEAKPPDVRHGQLTSGRYVDDGLALSATVPAGFSGSTTSPGVSLLINGAAGQGLGLFTFVPAPPSDELRRQMAAMFVGTLNGRAGEGQQVKEQASEEISLPLGKGHVMRLRSNDKDIGVILLPACGGKATFLLAAVTHDEAGRKALDGWLRSFQVDAAAAAPACDALDKPGS